MYSSTCKQGNELRCESCMGRGLHDHSLPSSSTSSTIDETETVSALLSLQSSNSSSTNSTPSTPTKSSVSSSLCTGRFEQGKTSPPRRSILDRYRMIIYKQDGMSQQDIVNKMKCSPHTIRKWNDAFKQSEDESLTERPGKRGRPRLIDTALENEIVQFVEKTPFITPKIIRSVFELDASKRTIDRTLIRHNLFGRRARRHHPKVKQNTHYVRYIILILFVC
jgi:transposase